MASGHLRWYGCSSLSWRRTPKNMMRTARSSPARKAATATDRINASCPQMMLHVVPRQSCSIVTSPSSALQCALEEPENPLFGVVMRSPGKPSGDESNVAAVRAELQCQRRTAIRHSLYALENVSWKEWIIRG